jgi:hypothetical protein
VRARLGLVTIVAVLGCAAPPALAQGSTKPPTTAQVKQAVTRAERSHDLWATVNVCHRRRFGIRGQMPALGFAATLSMTIQVTYWDAAHKRFRPLSGARAQVSLGSASQDLHQGGATWRFQRPARLSGTVTFEWRRAGKVIGSLTRETQPGIKGVDSSDPRGTSAAECRLHKH